MTYPCMTPDELAAWMEQAERYRREVGKGTTVPCFDCPAWFALEARAQGCCIREPQTNGRPRQDRFGPPLPGTILKRERNREWMRRYRAEQRLAGVQ